MSLKQDHGFTLVELIIYVAIIGFVLISFVYFALGLTASERKNYSVAETQANARAALQEIGWRIKGALSVNTSTSVFNSDNGILSLSVNDVSKNPTIIKISPIDNSLIILEGSSTTTITTSKVMVDKLFFYDFTSGTPRSNIQVDLKVKFNSSDSQEYTYTQSLSGVFNLRQ